MNSNGLRRAKKQLTRLASRGARPRRLRRLAAKVQRLIEDYQRRARKKREAEAEAEGESE